MRQVGATLHRGARASHCRGLSLRSTGSRRTASVVVAHGLSCSAACGIPPGQGLNPCPLHWQADSQPLRHQGSPHLGVLDNGCPLYVPFKSQQFLQDDPTSLLPPSSSPHSPLLFLQLSFPPGLCSLGQAGTCFYKQPPLPLVCSPALCPPASTCRGEPAFRDGEVFQP